MLGFGVSLIGVLAILTKLDTHVVTTLSFNWGDLLILFNMLLFAIYAAALRLRPDIHWLSFLFMFALLSGITTLPFWAWEHAHGQTLQPDWLTAFTLVYVTIVVTIVAYMSWNRGVELIGPNRAGIFLHLVPIFSALLAGVLLGEPLMSYHVVGFALILVGVYCAARSSGSWDNDQGDASGPTMPPASRQTAHLRPRQVAKPCCTAGVRCRPASSKDRNIGEVRHP
jgi:drug/metabolite transporter (DMT)-like permease